MTRDTVLEVCGISRHKYYHTVKSGKRGRKPTETTLQITDTGELNEVDVIWAVLLITSIFMESDKAVEDETSFDNNPHN